MKYLKTIRTMAIKSRSGESDTVPEGSPSNDALFDFEHEDIVDVGNGKLVPFHAIMVGNVETRTEWDAKPDGFFPKDCKYMDTPVIIGRMSEINVMAGEEFDPLDGITAKDDNGEVIPVEVSIKGE